MAVVSGRTKDGGRSVAADVRARLDAYAQGECDYEALAAAIRIFCKTTGDAVWEVLSVLDQYHRRGALQSDVFRSLNAMASYIALGPPIAAARKSVRVDGNTVPRADQSVPLDSAASPMAPAHPTTTPLEEPVTETHHGAAMSEAAQDAPTEHAPIAEPVPAEMTAAQFVANAAGGDHTLFHALPHDTPPQPPPIAPSASPHIVAGESTLKQEQRERNARQAALAQSVIPGRVLHDRYEIESALAFGRGTAVFRARDRFRTHDVERSLALKVLLVASLPNAAAQFEHELRIAQQLSHPNIVKVFDLDRDGELLFYSMELIAGQTLSDLLQFAPPRRPQAIAILTQVANALTYLHERGIAHGDVHPDNILISGTGQVKLLDFGAAVDGAASPPWRVAAADTPSGSLLYASCELLAGQCADRRDDIFSLSCIAYELLGREHPFRGKLATAARDAQFTPPRLPELSAAQWRSVQQGLSWRRDERPASVRQWLAGFEATASVSDMPLVSPPLAAPTAANAVSAPAGMPPPISAGPRIGVPPAPPRARHRHISSTWYIALLVGMLAVLAWVFMRFDFDTVTAPGLAKAQQSVKQAIDRGVESLAGPNAPRTSADASHAPLPQTAPLTESQANLSAVAPATNEHAPANNVAAAESSSVASAASVAGADGITESMTHVGGSGSAAEPAAAPNVVPPGNGAAEAVRHDKPKPVVESHGRISFAQDTFLVNKHDGAARIKLKRDDGAAGRVTFSWWAEPGTAEAGKDFMSLGKKTEVLDNGERELTVFVPLIVGSDNNNRHVFFVELSDPSNGLGVGRISRARVIIADE